MNNENLEILEIGDELYSVHYHEITKLKVVKKVRTEGFSVTSEKKFDFKKPECNVQVWVINNNLNSSYEMKPINSYTYAPSYTQQDIFEIHEKDFNISIFHERFQAVDFIQKKIKGEINDLMKKSSMIKKEAVNR